jgi:S1-C subfamily serine protease
MNTRLKAKVLPALLAAVLAGTTVSGLTAGAATAAFTRALTANAKTPAQTAQVVSANTAATVDTAANAPASTAPSAALPLATSVAASVADNLQAALEGVYAQANPSVVYIVVTAGSYSGQASGGGFVYDQNGTIVTNAHVVQGAQSIEVVFADGSKQPANPVGADAANDLAVIRVSRLPTGAVPLTLAANDSVQVGEFVAAIGSPFGEQNSMSFGIVSGLNRSMLSSSSRFGRSSLGSALSSLIQTDAPINPGNSGGPLLNLDGQVVGINNAIESTSGSGSGVGFAIPVSVIRQVVPGLIANAG